MLNKNHRELITGGDQRAKKLRTVAIRVPSMEGSNGDAEGIRVSIFGSRCVILECFPLP